MENENKATVETQEPAAEKTFTQSEVDSIIAKRVARAMKGVPDEAELAAYRSWKENRQSETEKAEAAMKERDEAKTALAAAQEELEAAKRFVYLLKKGITGDEAEFIEFKALKMADDTITFEKAVDELTKDRKAAVRVDFGGSLEGGSGRLTKEEIRKIKDPVQRQKAIAENLNLYRKG